MKLKPAQIDKFLVAPGDAVAALIYGPDEGLVRERAERLAVTLLGGETDPFARTDLTMADLGESSSRLGDEIASPTLLGGRRLVRLTGATDAAANALEAALAVTDPAGFLVITAGELSPRSRLRRTAEGASNAAAVACYPDEARDLGRLIRDTLAAGGFNVEEEAVEFLQRHLGGDRMVSRQELEKLMLYKGRSDAEAATITGADAAAAVGDSSAIAIDRVVDAATSGDLPGLERALLRLEAAGESAVAVLRVLARRLQRLQLLCDAVERGATPDKAIASLTPRPFWREAQAMKASADLWTTARIATAMEIVLEAEEKCKRTAMPAAAICAQACFRLAGAARRGQRVS